MPKYSNFYISLPNSGNAMEFAEMIRSREPFMRHFKLLENISQEANYANLKCLKNIFL
jgi:hypothetical protein